MSENHAHGDHGEPAHEHAAPHGPAAHGAPGHGAPAHGAPAHAAPAHHANLGRNIGMTMAVLGVLLAFSSAMVGGQRTELVATMIEHTSATGQFQAIATKHRVLQAQLQQLHAGMPDQPEFDNNEAELVKLEAELVKLEKEKQLPATASTTLHACRLETKKLLNAVIPSTEDLHRFARLVKKYAREREACKEWTESFEDRVHLHEQAAEHFELATLAAEIGIVMASIALLLHNRKAWLIAMTFGAASVTALAITGARTHLRLHDAEEKIRKAHAVYHEASAAGEDEREDEKLLKEVTGEPFDEKKVAAAHGEHHGENQGESHGENH